MLGLRMLAVVLLSLAFAIPAWGQDESGVPTDPTPVAAPSDEAAPPDQTGPAAEATPITTPSTPAPEPTLAPNRGPGSVAFADDFNDVTRANFPTAPVDPNTRSQGYIDGEYEVISGRAGGVAVAVPGMYADSSMAIDVRVFDGPAGPGILATARAGIACRVGENGGYEMRVYPTDFISGPSRRTGPRFQLVKFQPGQDVELVDQGPTPVIRDRGEVNRLELSCVGNTITGSINGSQVFSVTDGAYASGRHAFGVAGTLSRARFDNLVVTLR
jgi:hypothetical protein